MKSKSKLCLKVIASVLIAALIIPVTAYANPNWTPADRNQVPIVNGQPALRSDMETDMWVLVVTYGARLWGSSNEYNSTRFIESRLADIPGMQDVTFMVKQRGEPHNELSTPYTGRLAFEGWHNIYGISIPPSADWGDSVQAPLVDLGTFNPADASGLSVPQGTTGAIIGVLRYYAFPGKDYAFDLMELEPVLAQLEEENDGLEIERLLIAAVGDPSLDEDVHGHLTAIMVGWNSGSWGDVDDATPFFVGQDRTNTSEVETPRPLVTSSLHFLELALERADDFAYMENFIRNTSYSVHGTLPASTDDPDIIIVITAHHDSRWTPGAADNASGTSVMLESARRLAAVDRGNIEIIFLASGSHEGGGMRGSVYMAEYLRDVREVMDITININMDIVMSVGPGIDAERIDAISMDINMGEGFGDDSRLVYNLPAYLFVGGAADVWTPGYFGIDNVRIFDFGGSDHVRFTERGFEAASLIMVDCEFNGLEIQYHNARDNMEENYCYDRLNIAADIAHHGLMRAVNQQLTKRAQFAVDGDTLVLTNAAQIFNTFDRVEGYLDGEAFVFNSPENSVEADTSGDLVFTNVYASGYGTADHRNEERNALLNRFVSAMRAEMADAVEVEEVEEYIEEVVEVVEVSTEPYRFTSAALYFVDGAPMLPIREVARVLGADISWDGELRIVSVRLDGVIYTFSVDAPLPGGVGYSVIIDDRSFVPVEYVSEILGANVYWDEAAQAVYVS